MEQVLEELIESFVDFSANDDRGLRKSMFKGEDFEARLIANKDYIKLIVRRPSAETPKTDTVTTETDTKKKQCAKLKNDFDQYVNSFETGLFTQICKSIEPKKLKQMNDIYNHNTTDPELMQATLTEFKSLADKVIMEQVAKLKSQMGIMPIS